MTETFEPITSVVLIAGDQRARVGLALKSLLAQDGIERAEIIVLDCGSRPDLPPLPGSQHPHVRVIRWLERRPYGTACAEGARLARGRFVAFMEEHCQALPGYLTAIETVLGGEWVALGAEVHPIYTDLRLSHAILVMNYPAHLRSGARRMRTPILAGHNVAYRRDVLMAQGSKLEMLLENDTVFNSLLWQQGQPLGIDPLFKIRHANEKTLRAISQGYYLWHRGFANARWNAAGWSTGQKLLRLLMVPFMPLGRWGRCLKSALFERPADLPLVLLFAPQILIAQAAAAVGTALGYLVGPGATVLEFASYEIDIDRDLPLL